MVIEWIFSFLACAVCLYPLFLFFKLRCDKNSSIETAPMFTAPVTVFSKAMNNHRYSSSYFIAFSFPDGTRKNLPVSVEEYNTIAEGETGILTYRQDAKYIWFVSFQRTV